MTLKEFTVDGRVSEDRKRIDLDSPGMYRTSVHAMDSGARVTVRIKQVSSKRTLDQNAFWWAVPVKMLAEHCGYTESQMHYALLGECFGYVAGPTNQPVPVKPSSSDLTVEEFTHLIDWVLTWAPTELGVVIPEPSEYEAGRVG